MASSLDGPCSTTVNSGCVVLSFSGDMPDTNTASVIGHLPSLSKEPQEAEHTGVVR